MVRSNLSKWIQRSALAFTVGLPLLHLPAAQAAAPMVKTQAPGYYRFMLGSFEITALSDGTTDLPVEQLLSEQPQKTLKKLAASFLTSPVETSVNAYLVNTGDKLVLIDAGAGALFGPTVGKLLNNLRASGYDPNQVDEIYITHFHPDHLGGLLANGSIAFPNATVRAHELESNYWLSQKQMNQAPEEAKGFFQGAMTSMEPYVASGKYKPFSGDGELVPGVSARSSQGHTVGHTSYLVESQGQKLLLVGDLIHVAAVQLDKPQVTISFDTDPHAAFGARLDTFQEAAKEGFMIGAAHIQFPGLGHLRAKGRGFDWIPMNYTRIP